MSRINPRTLALLGAAALLLRLGAAAVTERHPIFPDYYYTDAKVINAASLAVMDRLDRGESFGFIGTLGQRTQVLVQTSVYRLVGIHPFAMKALNCVLGAAAVAAFAIVVAGFFSVPVALASAAFCAVWPSNVFYTSQNFKEAPNALLAYLGLACLLPLSIAGKERRNAGLWAAAGAACLIGVGFYRSYVMLMLLAALGAAFVAAYAARRALTRPIVLGLAAVLSAPLLYHPVVRFVMDQAMNPGVNRSEDARSKARFLPVTYDEKTENAYYPTTPSGITEFRRIRQKVDRDATFAQSGRTIATQLFPDARFETWFDVLAFLPKGAFYVLFMPLPGLYAMDGKIGRAAAAVENLILLTLAILAVAGALRGPRTPRARPCSSSSR